MSVTFKDIERARERVRGAVYETPCAFSKTFSGWCSNRIHFKLENLQMSGSFKERGALNCLASMSAAQRAQGVVAASAGNHAQGVSYHATRLGISATIVMPEYTPLIKVTNTQNFGANVVLQGKDYDEAYKAARTIAEEEGRAFVHAFDDEAVIAGQGTIGLELLEQNPYLDCVIVPVGGGGLISGIAIALKETNPRIRVVGVESEEMAAMKASREAGKIVDFPVGRTMADGIAVRRVGEISYDLVQKYVDDIVTVSEDAIANAILRLLETEKTVAEGAGAVSTAAALAELTGVTDKRVCCVVSGGIIDVNVLSRIIERGLVADGRLERIHVALPDRPGSLAQLCDLVGRLGANVIQIHHERTFVDLDIGYAGVELVLETRGPDHVAEVLSALADTGFKVDQETQTQF